MSDGQAVVMLFAATDTVDGDTVITSPPLLKG
jgi:hypothetical protein